MLARIDQMPQAAKKLALSHLEETIAVVKKKGAPNDTKAQQAFQAALLDDFHGFAKNVLDEGAEIRVDLDVNDASKELVVNCSITGKPQSELAKSFQQLGSLKSSIAGVMSTDAAFQGAFHFVLPNALHKAMEGVVQEAATNSVAGIQDAEKKKQAEMLFSAILPTAKSGEYNAVATVIGPKADRYTFLAAVKLKDGLKLGAIARDLIADAAKQVPASEKDKIQLDFDAVGAAKIHKFEAPKNTPLDALVNDIAGDKYVYAAFRDDALFLALGKEALPVLKAALAKTDGAASTPLLFDVDVARMAKWTARTPQQKEQAEKLVAAGASSRLRVSVEGGTSLRASVRTNFSVLEFLMKMSDQKGK